MTEAPQPAETATAAPPPERPDPTRSLAGVIGRVANFESTTVLIATAAVALFIGILHPDFFSAAQIKDTLQQSVYVAILAAGMAFLISMREIDLSVGSSFALTMIVAALLMKHGMDPWLAAVLGIALGAALGLFNAILVQVIAIPAIVATLATLSMYRGLAHALSNGQQVVGLPREDPFFTTFGGGHILGIQVSIWVLVAVVIVLTAVFRLTPFGYRVRSIGSNPEAATFSGISIARVRVQALVMMGALAGLSGMLALAFFASGDPTIGGGYELQAIAATVIGGTALRGGSGTVFGAVIGAVLLQIVSSGQAYFNVPANWEDFTTGAVILLAVSLDSLLRRRRRGEGSGLAL